MKVLQRRLAKAQSKLPGNRQPLRNVEDAVSQQMSCKIESSSIEFEVLGDESNSDKRCMRALSMNELGELVITIPVKCIISLNILCLNMKFNARCVTTGRVIGKLIFVSN